MFCITRPAGPPAPMSIPRAIPIPQGRYWALRRRSSNRTFQAATGRPSAPPEPQADGCMSRGVAGAAFARYAREAIDYRTKLTVPEDE